MAKIDKMNRFVLSIQVLALLVSVCFASSLSPLSGNRPRLPRSSSGCTLTLYDGDIGSSSSLELTTSDSSFVNDDWDGRASSAVVSGGCQWILYDTDFEENSGISSVVGPGNYPFNFSSNETTFGLPDNALSAVRCLPPEGTPVIVLFENHQYFGQMQVLNSSNSNLALINFDNMVSSLVIIDGVWEFYSGVNYTGSNITLGQGLYPDADDLTPIENDDLTSVRLTIVNCGTLNALANGQVSHTAGTNFGQTATYSCNTGYYLVGDSNRTCQATGVWSGSEPTCRSLRPQNAWYRIVHRESNRSLDGNGTIYPDSINRSIHLIDWNDGPYQRWRFNRVDDNHYTIINNATGEYLDGGSDDTGAPFNRRRVYLRDGFGRMWMFVNVSWPWFSLQLRTTGDVLDGAGNETYMLPYNVGELAQFREFQQWRLVFTEDINECVEGTHNCHQNATCNNAEGSFTCSCNSGYTGNGSSCAVVNCGTLNAPANGQVSHTAQTTFGQRATYSCVLGYILVGDSTRTCQANGVWSGNEPTCSLQDMRLQNAWYRIVHRESNRSLDGDGTIYQGSINRSIHLIDWNDGPYQRWRFNRVDDNYYTIINNATGEYLDGDGGGSSESDRVYLRVYDGGVYQQWMISKVCSWPWFRLEQRATGEVLDGAGDRTYMRPFNGGFFQQWRLILTEDINECTEGTHDCESPATCQNTEGSFTCLCGNGRGSNCTVNCGTLKSPPNGQVSHTAGTTFGQIATYSCDTGYNLVGESNRTCQATGRWSGSEPTCRPQSLVPQNAWYRIVHRQSNRSLDGNGTFYQDSINRSIHLIDWNDGPYQRWRFNRVDNNYYTIINNATGEYLDGGSDDTAFNRRRVYSRVRDGSVYQQWRINECRPWINLIHPATGEFEVLDGADNETYMLFYNGGPFQQWMLVLTEDINECIEGTHNCHQNATCINTEGSFMCSCDPGYTGNGSSCMDINECVEGIHDCHQNATCNNTEGSFTCSCNTGYTGNGSSCMVVDCGTLTDPANGQVNHTAGTTFGQTATYSCDAGYQLLENFTRTRTCQADGVWSGNRATCVIVPCGAPNDIANGQRVYGGTPGRQTATYSCNTGYNLVGNRTRTCQPGGVWSGSEPTCEAVDCGTLNDTTNGRVSHPNGTTFGQTAIYSCDTGYNLVGDSTRTCQATGNWSENEPACIIVDCGTLTDPANGQVSHTAGTAFGQTATYSCDLGYNLVGDSTRTCQANGMWSGNEPICEPWRCEAETTGLLFWPATITGTTRTLQCPNTTTMISRTCSLSGVWEGVDLTLCTSFTSINTDTITLDNYGQVLSNVSGAVRGAATSEREQTTSNLTVVATAFEMSAAQLANETTVIPNTTVQNLVNTLEGLQQWKRNVLQANASNIVRSYEEIVSMFAQQLEGGNRIPFMTENILVVTELLSRVELAEAGRSFSSGGQTRSTSINTLSENETAAAFLPPSLYQSITDRNNIGSFFAVYNSGALFPTTNATTVVGSPVLAATVGSGLNFSNLTEPVRILLRLNELENINSTQPRCVSWNFGMQEWTTEGCETDLSEVIGGVVTCRCSHLTNFAVLTNVICNGETTGFFFWPDTLAGNTRTLQCPNTTTMISRTCSLSGVWESVDLTLCTSFTSINTNNVTLDNYEEVLTSISGAVRGAAINEQEQSTNNLAMVAATFERSAALINEMTIVPNTTVENLVSILDGLQQWNEEVLQANASNIVRSFDTIVSVFAQQLEDREIFSVMTENVLFVAEALPQAELAEAGRSFLSGGETGNTSISTLSENTTTAAFLPASLFQSIVDRMSVGVVFAVYDTGVLFPITNATEQVQGTNASITTVVGSPVLGVTVGPGLNFSNLTEPVRILLRLNELENVTSQPQCVSWDFDREEWTTDGCVTLAEMNESVVTCNCNHLTNFAILVDICSRFQDCMPSPPPLQNALETLTIVGVVLSLTGIGLTVFTLLFFKKFRERVATIFHVQLCIALFYMLIIFVCGINRTAIHGACVAVSALIHYFTLVAVMFMGAEAVLMFQKLVIVFGSTSTKFFITVSLICWLVPIIPVVIPMAVDLSDVVSGDLVVRMPTSQSQGFCFINDPAVFFGAFLGPIFAILIVNVVIFVLVIGVIIRHTRNKLDRTKEQMNKKTAIRLVISIAGIMFLFGLTWLFGALTVTGFGSATASFAFQVLFVICNAFQGFFIFLFFCVFNKDARDLWLELLSCGRYKSKPLHSSQAKYGSSGGNATLEKIKTNSSGLTNSNLVSAISSKSDYNSSVDDLSKEERYTDIPLTLTSAAEQETEKPSVVTFKDDPEIHETNVGTDRKDDLESSEVKEKEPVLETSENSEVHASPNMCEVNKEDPQTSS